MGHVDAPRLKHLVMIDSHRLELYWDQEVEHQDIANDYKILKNSTVLEVDTSREEADDNWATRPIYEPIKKRTTLYLLKPLKKNEMMNLKIITSNKITNKAGDGAKEVEYKLHHWQNFYTRFTQTENGLIIKSSDNVSREAHRKAKKIIDQMLIKIPDIASKLVAENVELAIYGREEDAYDIPEHRGGSDILGRPVEGFGGCIGNPTTSISEVNILRIIDGPNQTRYRNECILVHEFGHAIHLVGINQLEDQRLAKELVECYENAKENNLWPNTYIISNYEEYFATLCTIWFDVMAESADGKWDGVRGPINRREELEIYDPRGYNYFSQLFNSVKLPYPWNETPKFYPETFDLVKDKKINEI